MCFASNYVKPVETNFFFGPWKIKLDKIKKDSKFVKSVINVTSWVPLYFKAPAERLIKFLGKAKE